MIDDECGVVGGMRIGRGNRSTRRKSAPVPHCPPQIPHYLSRDRTQAGAVGSRRLTAWAMAWRFIGPCSVTAFIALRLLTTEVLQGQPLTANVNLQLDLHSPTADPIMPGLTACPRQHGDFWFRVQRDPWPYFTFRRLWEPSEQSLLASIQEDTYWYSPAQSFLVSSPAGTHDLIYVRYKPVYVSEMGSLLREDEEFVSLSKRHICFTVISHECTGIHAASR
jgi:hypothetical protein